jgi:PhzF family phenazine biosynthesis protein
MRLLQIDAFTDKPFRGNPAAVCLLDSERDAQWMQSVAAEMNLAETAFLLPANGGYSLRWFSPIIEIDLCGHATLASAHALWEENAIPGTETAKFQTKSGVLTAKRVENGWIELDFPATPASPIDPPSGLFEALGVKSRYVGKTRFDYLVEVDSADVVRKLQPDHAKVKKLAVRGVIVTARGDGEFDFVSRFFAPGAGIEEDPVTGSAHCALAPYWSPILGKTEFLAYQASQRGGVLHVRLAGDRVKLRGRAITVLRGQLAV